MQLSLPSIISDIPVSARVPADQLMTLGRIFSEVGGYASAFTGMEHSRLAGYCFKRLHKVVAELKHRNAIRSEKDIYALPSMSRSVAQLAGMSVDELEQLYRAWPVRRQERIAEGREPLTFYLESKIVMALRNRKAENIGQQLKIDYCTTSYNIEIHNMASLLGLPVGKADNQSHSYVNPEGLSVSQLVMLIQAYGRPEDIMARERLVEAVDRAVEFIISADDKQKVAALAAELVAIESKNIIGIPEIVGDCLSTAVKEWNSSPTVAAREMVVPLLTKAMVAGNKSLCSKARRIINSCYRAGLTANIDIPSGVADLYVATQCHEYVTRFKPARVAARWEKLCTDIMAVPQLQTAEMAFRMLAIANELKACASFSEQKTDMLCSIIHRFSPTPTIAVDTHQVLTVPTRPISVAI